MYEANKFRKAKNILSQSVAVLQANKQWLVVLLTIYNLFRSRNYLIGDSAIAWMIDRQLEINKARISIGIIWSLLLNPV